MDLDEYLWKNKIRGTKFAKLMDANPNQVSMYVHKKQTPSLLMAAKIVHASEGKISYEELLKPQDKESLDSYMKSLNP